MMKRAKSRKGILKNNKGFTFIEAIAVVAIMGVIAVVVGGLVSSATTAYMRQKETASAKDLSVIVTNEIARNLTSAYELFLENGDLPNGSVVNGETTYRVDDGPFNDLEDPYYAFYSEDGILMYTYYDAVTRLEKTISYFTDGDDESNALQRAFYGSFKINAYFRAIQDGAGNFITIKIFVDVYKNEISEGNLKYEAPGAVVNFLEASLTDGHIVHSYTNTYDCTQLDGTVRTYIDMIATNGTATKYSHMYFASR